MQWQLESKRLVVRSPHLRGDAWTPTANRVLRAGDSFKLLGRIDRIEKIA